MRENSIAEQLRVFIRESGQSNYAIWKATGISQASLSRFMNGERSVSLEFIERLAKHLRLRIVADRR